MSTKRKPVPHTVESPRDPAGRKPRLARERAGAAAARGSAPGEAQLGIEQEPARHEKKNQQNVAAPRAGRTSGMGRRAEKPSEGTHKQSAAKTVEPGRSSKAPSARQPRETPVRVKG